ncbi:MAG: LysR family transcriptional regulator [Proteobacteria bacterium]|nr:LysR family transcriptional regulator [Pseudomonadota bacterium]
MNLNQLRVFYNVIKMGAYSKAAEELCVTEPAVFIQVRLLERYVGFTLINRFGKELRPTEIGKLLYEYAEKIFTLVDDLTIEVNELQELKKGSLRLGSTRAIAQYLMPIIISSFQDSHPHISVHLVERGSQELVDNVMQHLLDLAIVAKVPYPEQINAIPFSKDDILMVIAPQNKLANKRSVSLKDLVKEPLICTDARSAIKFSIWKEFEKRDLHPSVVIEAGNIEFIKQLVKKNKGFSFLSSISVRDEIEKGELSALTLKDEKFSIDIDVIHLKGKTLSPIAANFLNFLQEHKHSNRLWKLAEEITQSVSQP